MDKSKFGPRLSSDVESGFNEDVAHSIWVITGSRGVQIPRARDPHVRMTGCGRTALASNPFLPESGLGLGMFYWSAGSSRRLESGDIKRSPVNK